MIVTIGETALVDLLRRQVDNLFTLTDDERRAAKEGVMAALPRTKKCLGASHYKYYWDAEGRLLFNPFHSGQYATFLLFAAQEALRAGSRSLADKIFYLNKTLNGCDIYYEVPLPDIFFLEHPLGAVLGRAVYGDYFCFQQNCTVGGNHDIYPRFGEFVWMHANAVVIGDATVGSNVFIAAGAYIKDEDVPDNSIVFGGSPNLVIKRKPPEYFYQASPFLIHRERLA